jgi:DNA/RNA-binding domain of Phe-tRNA-synthetase-like protein
MKFKIEESVLDLFPDLTVGIVAGEVTEERGDVLKEIARMRIGAMDRLRSHIPDLNGLVEHPHVDAWRRAYGAFGVKAKTYKPTHEAFARRLLKNDDWPTINPLVDIYLLNQAATLLPHGGFDTDTLTGDLVLKVSEGGEPFEPLAGGEEFTQPGEVVYRDDRRVVTRRFNYRDADATKITDSSRRLVLLMESPSTEIPADTVAAAARELAERYERCYLGQFRSQVVRPTRGAAIFEF